MYVGIAPIGVYAMIILTIMFLILIFLGVDRKDCLDSIKEDPNHKEK